MSISTLPHGPIIRSHGGGNGSGKGRNGDGGNGG